jgi:hypothetical protein
LDTDDRPDLNVPQWCHVFEFSVQKNTCIPQIDVVSVLLRVLILALILSFLS